MKYALLEVEKEKLETLRVRFLDLSNDFKRLYKQWKIDFWTFFTIFSISVIGFVIFALEKNVVFTVLFASLLLIFYVASLIPIVHMSECKYEALYCEGQAEKIQRLIQEIKHRIEEEKN